MSDFARIEQRQCCARTLQTVDEAEPFDWTPEVDLVKGLIVPARVQVLLDYFDAARKRASARSQVFVHTVIEDSGLDGEGLAARLRDDAGFAALFEGALEAGMRSAHDQKVLLLARVVAQAANDTASVDDAELVASTIRELQPPHVRALTILADHKMQHPDASGVAAVIEGMAGLRTRGPGKATGSSQILRALMGVADDVADSVSATLERQGLIWNDPPGFGAWGITDYGWRILNLLRNTNVAPDGQTALAGDVTACASGDQQTHRGDQIPGGRA
jgi:hypothetical protein